MTQEEKQLLIRDLCARLSFKIKGVLSFDKDKEIFTIEGCEIEKGILYLSNSEGCYVDDFKPFLRPMSSMTEEEMDKLFDILHIDKTGNGEDWIKINDIVGIKFFFPTGKWVENVAEAYDYLNSIHIDYRGLIPMGLALEAPEGMYNTKTE